MELVEPLDAQPPSAAVAGGWAAIEALLTGPGDRDQRMLAGDRMAALVACSFPRAELTTLPKRGLCKHERHSPGGEIASEARRDQQAQEEWTRRFCDRSCKACCHQSLISGPRTEFRHGTQKALARGPGRREEVCDLWQSTEPCQLPCEVRQGFVRAW
jgi:hypothetical protein